LSSPGSLRSEFPTTLLVWNPNPTLDVVNKVGELDIGAVHRADEQMTSPGGKGTLVVRGLNILDVPCLGVAPIAGAIGQVVGELFKGERLPMLTNQIDGVTRFAITVSEGGGRDTVINGPGPDARGPRWAAHVESVAEKLRTIQPSYFVIAGRPPLNVDLSDVHGLIEEASNAGARTVLDMSSPILESCLPLHPWLVKINASEARDASRSSLSRGDLAAALMDLGAQNAVLTDGPGVVAGHLLGVSFEAAPPRVAAVSAVGCGDSFLAGLLSGLVLDSTYQDTQAVLRRAIAAGSASAEDLRPGFFSRSRAAQLEDLVSIQFLA
jgi:fructose-1-phosphate kinase PfkB-like protein